tara:strand:- start:303 stop:524 length:222 start_codon:yes stop_codon:yes gene_type:complete
MATLSAHLLKFELSQWLKLKNAIDKTPKGIIHDFGAMMNSKYNLNDKQLSKEIDHNMALLLILSKHVQQETEV